MYYFGTLFDRNYLTRGLVLYKSMLENIDDFILFVLALDQESYDYIESLHLHNLKPVSLNDIESKYEELIMAKQNRTIFEYYFTLSPVLPLYLLECYPEIDFITTLDSDICFFSSPKQIFDEFRNYSILITAHDYTDCLNYKRIFGNYNVSFQSFRRDKEGMLCLTRWKEQCIEWCYYRLEDGKFADQKYLDSWKSEYQRLYELSGRGAGIAPWNVSKYKISKRYDSIFCGSDKLIFYHFHGVKFITSRIIRHDLNSYNVKMNRSIKKYLYEKYIFLLLDIQSGKGIGNSKIPRMNLISKKPGVAKMLKNESFFYLFTKSRLVNIDFQPLILLLKYSILLPFVLVKRNFVK